MKLRVHSIPLDAGQDSGDIVGGAPSVLKDIQAQLACGIDVGVEHLADELDGRRLVRILLLEMHHESESAVLKWRVGGSDDDGIPCRLDVNMAPISCLARLTKSSHCQALGTQKHRQADQSACAVA